MMARLHPKGEGRAEQTLFIVCIVTEKPLRGVVNKVLYCVLYCIFFRLQVYERYVGVSLFKG